MGNLCDCFNSPKDERPTPKTPLLHGKTEGHDVIPKNEGLSARVNKPGEQEKDFLTSLEVLSLIELGRIPSVSSLDKTFQDHAKLYNDVYSTFVDLRRCLHDFKAKFESDTAGIPILAECLRILGKRCGGATLSGSRTRNCIQISYDKREVSELCHGPPEEVTETLELYNKANKLIRQIMDKAPKVKSSIDLVLEEEAKLKREVTKADPDGRNGPEPLRVATANFTKLHKLPLYVDTIMKYTKKTFMEVANGSKVLFEDSHP